MPFTNDDLQIEQSIIYPATGYLVSHLISPDARAVPLPWDFLEEMKRRWDSHDDLTKALKGVIRVADRQTDEFDAARAALAIAEKS